MKAKLAFSMKATEESLKQFAAKFHAENEPIDDAAEEASEPTARESEATESESQDSKKDSTPQTDEPEEIKPAKTETKETTNHKEEKEDKVEKNSDKSIVAKQVQPVAQADPADAGASAARGMTKTEAREAMGRAFIAIAENDTAAVKELAMQFKEAITGPTGTGEIPTSIFATDVREAYQIVGRIGAFVSRVDIEGASKYSELVETAGTGFARVAGFGGVKSIDTPEWAQVDFEPKEWAIIVPYLKAVAKRLPIAVYQQVVRYVARQLARLEDRLILSYTGGTVATGVVDNATGIFPLLEAAGEDRVVSAGGYAAAQVNGALGEAYGNVESDGELVLVCNRKTWGKLATVTDANGKNIFTVVGDQVSAGALGTFNVVRSTEAPDDKAVIGYFGDYLEVSCGGVEQLLGQEASIGTGENVINLFTQNAEALRASADLDGGALSIKSFVEIDFSESDTTPEA